MLGRMIFAAVSVLGGVMSAPALAGVPGCPEAGQVVGFSKISEVSGGFTGDLDPNDRFGVSPTNIGDLDGDGVTDLAVGAYGDDDGGIERGAVYIFFMNANGTVRGQQKISSTAGGFTGPLDNNDSFGVSLASLGDLDGDGVSDLAVASLGDDDGGTDRGALYILFLNTNGTVRAQQKISSTAGGFTGPLDNSDEFGHQPASMGDLDGDGVTDLAVGAFRDDDGGTDRGAVYILFMNTNGTVRAQQKISSTAGGFVGPLDNGDAFGARIANIGDLDGDGLTDLAVGAIFDDDGGTDRGALYILFMNTNGTVRAQQKISSTAGGFSGPLDNSDLFGSCAALGDLDGDGVADLAGGAPNDDDGGTDRGAVYILFMNTNGTVKAERKLSAAGGFTGTIDNGDSFGGNMGSLGDLDGDGFTDLAVSAVLDDDGGTDIGAIWMLEIDGCDTPPMIVQNVSPACVLLPAAGGSTGFSITATGDGTLTYQWRKDGVALVNGGPISGANSPSLTIAATLASEGTYDCVVTNAFGTATSAGAMLGVRASCAGDADSSGAVGLSDIAIVVQNWTTVCE